MFHSINGLRMTCLTFSDIATRPRARVYNRDSRDCRKKEARHDCSNK